MTTVTPTPPPQTPRRSGVALTVSLLTAAFGVIVLIVSIWGGAAPTVAASLTRTDHARTADVDGVRALDIDVAAAEFILEFADVEQAELQVRDAGNGTWSLEVRDGTLRVGSPRSWFGAWFGGGNGIATLTLPEALAGSDLDVEVGAGSFVADGAFGDLDLEMGAGQAILSGSARELDVQVGAGSAELDLADVRSADLDLSAGAMTAVLTGTAPAEVSVSASAGSVELTLPDAVYDVTSEVSGGSLENDLRTASGAPNSVDVEVSAGEVTLTPGS